jgi:NADH:ubiquinone oxidoreductase subunit H
LPLCVWMITTTSLFFSGWYPEFKEQTFFTRRWLLFKVAVIWVFIDNCVLTCLKILCL